MNKRGVQNILASVLLVLLAIIAIALIWAAIQTTLTRSATDVTLSQECLSVQFIAKSCTYAQLPPTVDDDGNPVPQVNVRGYIQQTTGNPTAVQVIVRTLDSKTSTVRSESTPLFVSRRFSLNMPAPTNPSEVLLAPVTSNGETERVCQVQTETFPCGPFTAPPGNLCDGVLDQGDIEPFLTIMRDLTGAEYNSRWGSSCPIINADFNCDGFVNNFDIDYFIAQLNAMPPLEHNQLCS